MQPDFSGQGEWYQCIMEMCGNNVYVAL